MSKTKDPFAMPNYKKEEGTASSEVNTAAASVTSSLPSVDDLEMQAASELAHQQLANKVPVSSENMKNTKRYTDEELAGIKIEDIDWSKVTEEDILRLPLQAKSFEDIPMLSVKPKDSSVVFYYAYCGTGDMKTNQQGPANIAKLKAKGYQFVRLEDIAGGEDNLLEGSVGADGHIRYYDVVLMKINKLLLYQHMKAKIMESMSRTDPIKVNKMAAASAEAFVENANGSALAQAREKGQNVSFYN